MSWVFGIFDLLVIILGYLLVDLVFKNFLSPLYILPKLHKKIYDETLPKENRHIYYNMYRLFGGNSKVEKDVLNGLLD